MVLLTENRNIYLTFSKFSRSLCDSFALKTASTMLSATDKKKVDKVDDLLAIASNDASTEHEKKIAFQQAFKHLEGIIVVPEVAVETFKVKIGLKELEMVK